MSFSRISFLFLVVILVFTTACGTTSRSKRTFDDAYKTNTLSAIETGVASWYGPNFNGKLTANGEIYDMDGMTAAHRTLPFNTVVKVENLDNGQSVVVRINDRGPFAKNRIIDLSREAAKRMQMIGPGTARVRLYVVEGEADLSRVKDLKNATYTVQLASYKSKVKADELSGRVRGSRVQSVQVDGETWYRVYMGTFTDVEKAKQEQQRLEGRGIDGFVKQLENN
ncbi:MAG: septal ring lytic transglycosylase RlpA family protein [Bacteroidota bacterium]